MGQGWEGIKKEEDRMDQEEDWSKNGAWQDGLKHRVGWGGYDWFEKDYEKIYSKKNER